MYNAGNADIVLIPVIISFRPVQNTNLSWIASIIGYKIPVSLMVVIQGLGLIIIFLAYRYFSYLWIHESQPYIYYGITRKFYQTVVFKPLECIPELWGKDNPCLIMIQYL